MSEFRFPGGVLMPGFGTSHAARPLRALRRSGPSIVDVMAESLGIEIVKSINSGRYGFRSVTLQC